MYVVLQLNLFEDVVNSQPIRINTIKVAKHLLSLAYRKINIAATTKLHIS